MLDIRDFGPVDPTGVRDCTAALQNAINAVANAISAGAGLNQGVDATVYVPAGLFWIKSQITIPNTGGTGPTQRAIRITGEGAGIPYYGTSGSILKMTYGSRQVTDAAVQVPSSAPALVASTTGGGITSGTYTLLYTYYNNSPPSETVASLMGQVTVPPNTTSGSIAVTTPPVPGGYTGINVYLFAGLSGGATGKVQTAVGNSLTLTTLSPTGALPSSLTSATANFTQADVGSFVVAGSGSSDGTTGIPTGTVILAVNSATGVLLSYAYNAILGIPAPSFANATGLTVTINGPKIVTVGAGILEIDHVALSNLPGTSNVTNLPDTAPFILTINTVLRVRDVVFWGGSSNIRTITDGVTTANSTTLTSSSANFGEGDIGAQLVTTDPAIPANTFIAAVASSTSCTMSRAATTGKTVPSIAILSSMQDAVILGGPAPVNFGTAYSGFAGYGTVIEKCLFYGVRRAAYFRMFCNGAVFRDNEVTGFSGASVNEAAIDIEGGGVWPDVGAGNLVAGNIVEVSWSFNGIRINRSVDNTLVNNWMGDAGHLPGTNSYLLTAYAAGNTVMGGYFDGLFTDNSGGLNTVLGPFAGNVISHPLTIWGNITGNGSSESLLNIAVPSGVAATAQGQTGSTTYSYRVTALSASSVETIATSAVQITTGNASLSTINYNQISIPPVAGALSYNIYGRTSGSEKLMTNVNATGGTVIFNDTGAISPGSINPPTATTGNKLAVQAWQSQTNNLQEWQSSGGTVLDNVGNDGRLYVQTPNSAPTDSNILNSQTTFYVDEVNGKLMLRVRYSSGTYKTGSVTLS